jgi:hypothetical protein
MIELLVVLAIVAILVAFLAGAVSRILQSQNQANTNTTLSKLKSAVNKQWAAVVDKARNEAPNATAVTLSGGNPALARVIHIKMRLKQVFPVTFDEVLNPNPTYDLTPLATYKSYLKAQNITGSSGNQAFESSVCLLMALQVGTSGTGVKMEDLGVNSSIADLTLPSGTVVKGLVDAWGTPLFFCRWATAFTDMNPSGAQSGLNDAGDPQGLLNTTTFAIATNSNFTTFKTLLHDLPARAANSQPTSYVLTPIIASAGPDMTLGLDTSTYPIAWSTTSTYNAADNLYSTNVP